MEARRIVAVSSALVILGGVVVDTAMASISEVVIVPPMNTSLLVELANTARASINAPPLKESAVLERAALLKAHDMVAKGYFSHTSPNGTTPWSWMRQAGYLYSFAGENLAIEFTDPNDVHTAWMRSSSHRGNILNTTYTEIGIATAQGMYEGRSVTYIVELFGTPKKIVSPPVRRTTTVPRVTPILSPTAVTEKIPHTFLFLRVPFSLGTARLSS